MNLFQDIQGVRAKDSVAHSGDVYGEATDYVSDKALGKEQEHKVKVQVRRGRECGVELAGQGLHASVLLHVAANDDGFVEMAETDQRAPDKLGTQVADVAGEEKVPVSQMTPVLEGADVQGRVFGSKHSRLGCVFFLHLHTNSPHQKPGQTKSVVSRFVGAKDCVGADFLADGML